MPRSGQTGSGGVGSTILDAGENRSKSPEAKMSWPVQEVESHCGRIEEAEVARPGMR